MKRAVLFPLLLGIVLTVLCLPSEAQSTGVIEGVVTLPTDSPVHRATVLLIPLGRIAETDTNGRFRFDNLPLGSYEVAAFRWLLSAEVAGVPVTVAESRTLVMRLGSGLGSQQTTYAEADRPETIDDAVAAVTVFDPVQIPATGSSLLENVLDPLLGVSRRSFGAAITRPIVRGFDGDRVMILEDGVRGGSLASQSGDHMEPIGALGFDRLEFVRGPETLLYGSNATGSMFNAVRTPVESYNQPYQGFSGSVSSAGGTGNAYAASNVNMRYGQGNWQLWAGGGGQRAGDYNTSIGPVANSRSRTSNGSGGFGWYDRTAFLGVDYSTTAGRYGIPFADEFRQEDGARLTDLEEVNIDFRRHNVRVFGGATALGTVIDGLEFSLDYSYWNHNEVETFSGETPPVSTTFENRKLTYRVLFEQQPMGRLGGRFGVEASSRMYRPAGVQPLSPPVRRSGFAVFALEELALDQVGLEFGGRIEYAGDAPRGLLIRRRTPGLNEEEIPGDLRTERFVPRDRSYTGASVAVGALYEAWDGGTFRAHANTSYRAPALEELYSFGPHAGRATFDIGNPRLHRERTTGVDLSFRHRQSNFRGGVSVFYYDIDEFVFLAPRPQARQGLLEAEYAQSDGRFRGMELSLDVALPSSAWLNMGMEMVDTKLALDGGPAPRIPPLRATFGLDYSLRGIRFQPQIVVADAREDVFAGESRTAGYSLVNLAVTYTIPREYSSHNLAFNLYNAGNRLYRNHASFIKSLVPEMGRGLRFSYEFEFRRPISSGVSDDNPVAGEAGTGRRPGQDR